MGARKLRNFPSFFLHLTLKMGIRVDFDALFAISIEYLYTIYCTLSPSQNRSPKIRLLKTGTKLIILVSINILRHLW